MEYQSEKVLLTAVLIKRVSVYWCTAEFSLTYCEVKSFLLVGLGATADESSRAPQDMEYQNEMFSSYQF